MVQEFGTLCMTRPERKGRAMLIIKIKDEVLTYDLKRGRWVCSDRVLEQVVNNMLPDRHMTNSVIFSKNGAEHFVLKHMEETWGDTLKVIAFEPVQPPPAEEGVVY